MMIRSQDSQLSARASAHELATDYSNTFSEQDEHVQETTSFVHAWLENTIFSIYPVMSLFLEKDTLNDLWYHVPFAGHESLYNCMKRMTLNDITMLWYLQLMGVVANTMQCENCDDDCELHEVEKKDVVSYFWTCRKRACRFKKSVWHQSWFAKSKKRLANLDCILMHITKVSIATQSALLSVSEASLRDWIQEYQQACKEKMATVSQILDGDLDIDGTSLQKVEISKSKDRECFNFRDTGACLSGNKCRFSHANQATTSAPVVSSTLGALDSNADISNEHNEHTLASLPNLVNSPSPELVSPKQAGMNLKRSHLLMEGDVDVTATRLSGSETQKKSYGRPRGALRCSSVSLILLSSSKT
jgi:hypothetical protein